MFQRATFNISPLQLSIEFLCKICAYYLSEFHDLNRQLRGYLSSERRKSNPRELQNKTRAEKKQATRKFPSTWTWISPLTVIFCHSPSGQQHLYHRSETSPCCESTNWKISDQIFTVETESRSWIPIRSRILFHLRAIFPTAKVPLSASAML